MNVIIFFIVVLNAILLLCILSYLQCKFERDLSKNKLLEENIGLIKKLAAEMQMFNASIECLKNDMGKLYAELQDINKKLDQIYARISSSDKKPEELVTDAAYNDAVIAFENTNNAIYDIRKYHDIAHALLGYLYSGENMAVDLSIIPDNIRENIASIVSRIRLFNGNYRPTIDKKLNQLGMTWEECVRFPSNKTFDSSWDEHLLGDIVEDGTIIKRVISLGYEFPKSIVIGRHKSKIR